MTDDAGKKRLDRDELLAWVVPFLHSIDEDLDRVHAESEQSFNRLQAWVLAQVVAEVGLGIRDELLCAIEAGAVIAEVILQEPALRLRRQVAIHDVRTEKLPELRPRSFRTRRERQFNNLALHASHFECLGGVHRSVEPNT